MCATNARSACALRACMRLQAYDQHMNMVLGDVEETIVTTEVDEETQEEIVKVRARARARARPNKRRRLCPRRASHSHLAEQRWKHAALLSAAHRHARALLAGRHKCAAHLCRELKRAPKAIDPPVCSAWSCRAADTSLWLQTAKRTTDFIFVRGDIIILISPPLRSA